MDRSSLSIRKIISLDDEESDSSDELKDPPKKERLSLNLEQCHSDDTNLSGILLSPKYVRNSECMDRKRTSVPPRRNRSESSNLRRKSRGIPQAKTPRSKTSYIVTKSKTSSPRSKSQTPNPNDTNIDIRSPRISPGRKGESRINVKLIEPIGKGGSGTSLWKANVSGWGCCVKELPLKMCVDADIEIFENEIKILQTLPVLNTHFVKYLGFQKTDVSYQLIMQLYDGTLGDLIEKMKKKNEKFTVKQITMAGFHVIQALNVLHSRRLMHRDIKSSNVLFEGSFKKLDDINYVLGDFGESKIILPNSKANTVVGTSLWIAPEVLTATKLDHYSFSADIWSFGMLLYEMITLKFPYYDVKGFGAHLKILSGKLPTLTSTQKSEYYQIVSVLEDCLIFEPSKRPTSAQLIMRFQTILDHI